MGTEGCKDNTATFTENLSYSGNWGQLLIFFRTEFFFVFRGRNQYSFM